MDVDWIERRFAKSITSYGEAAIVQRAMASELCDLITQTQICCEFNRVFEIGCGTGVMTQEFLSRFGCNELILNDLVSDCNNLSPKGSTFLSGDIEHLDLPKELDIVISNAVFQWLKEPAKLLHCINESLSEAGILTFSVFGPENCRELNSYVENTLKYRTSDEWSMLLGGEFEILGIKESIHQLFFDNPEAVLRHLQATGVTATGAGERWTKGRLKEFIKSYNAQFRDSEKVSLTYHPILILAKKTLKNS